MKAFPSASDLLGRLEPRERRVVAGGALILGVALVIAWLVLPFAAHWSARNEHLAATRERWVRLQGLVASSDQLRRTLDAARRAAGVDQTRLVAGATPALAASALQELVQRNASQSTVQLERVDAAGEPQPDRPGLLAIPVQLQARGDLFGFVNFMSRVESGTPLLVVDELTMDAGSGGADDDDPANRAPKTLAWTIRLHGLYAQSAGPTP